MMNTIKERSVTHATFVIERSYPASAARVFAAFADPAKKKRWFAEGEGFDVDEFKMDFRVGGSETTRFHTKDGMALTNNTVFHDIVPDHRIVFAYTMSVADKRISASLVTVEFLPDDPGSRLVFTEQGAFFDGADGPAMREDGWRQLLAALAEELSR
jgi:uncharacterized protein YndB with AHSA1/START domain